MRPELEEFVGLFNREKFLEAHEALEGVWRKLQPGSERDFYQGLIQAAAALVHVQRKNLRGAQSLLESARGYLENAEPFSGWIDLEPFLDKISSCIEGRPSFPRISLKENP